MKFELKEVQESTMGYHNHTDRELIKIAMEYADKDSLVYQLAIRFERILTMQTDHA